MKYVFAWALMVVFWAILPVLALFVFFGIPGVTINGHGKKINGRAINYTL